MLFFETESLQDKKTAMFPLDKKIIDKFGNLVTMYPNLTNRGLKMSQVIRVPESIYIRLEKHANGFDTPGNVIEKILNFYEKNSVETIATTNKIPTSHIESPTSLEISYHPEGENIFKTALLEKKQAYIRLHKMDGTSEIKVWNASKLSQQSDVNANLRSGYLRGWKGKGIYKATIAIDETDIA